MVEVLGFGIGLKEIEYIVFAFFLGFLALQVFIIHPDNVFDAINATADAFFPTGEQIAYTSDAFVSAFTTNDIIGMIYGTLTGSLSALLLIIKGIIALTFVYAVVFQGLIPFYQFLNSW